MFGRDSVPKTFKGDTVAVVVDGKTAKIDFSTLVSPYFIVEVLATRYALMNA